MAGKRHSAEVYRIYPEQAAEIIREVLGDRVAGASIIILRTLLRCIKSAPYIGGVRNE
jgi:hypothetical protein